MWLCDFIRNGIINDCNTFISKLYHERLYTLVMCWFHFNFSSIKCLIFLFVPKAEIKMHAFVWRRAKILHSCFTLLHHWTRMFNWLSCVRVVKNKVDLSRDTSPKIHWHIFLTSTFCLRLYCSDIWYMNQGVLHQFDAR